MNNVETVANMLAEVYRKIDRDEITQNDLMKSAFLIGIPVLEQLSQLALKNGNQKVYQTIVFACSAVNTKKDEIHQK